MKSLLFSLVILLPILIIVVTIPISAELYQDYNGKLISEEEYMQRVNICDDKIATGELDSNIDCLKWALTEDAQAYWYFEYKVKKNAEDALNNYLNN